MLFLTWNFTSLQLLAVDVEPDVTSPPAITPNSWELVTEEMLQSDGQNSIIIVDGANMIGWPEKMIDDELEIVRNDGVVQLPREIPHSINIQVAKVLYVGDGCVAGCEESNCAGHLTWKEWIPPIPNELLDSVDILQHNETELCRLTGMPTKTF
ncbi:unnamed protein product [Brassica oleracea]